MQKTLTILRHADAQPAAPGQDDHERALSAKGRNEAEMVGECLIHAKTHFDLIVCSPSTRTKETLEQLPFTENIVFSDAMYLSSARQLMGLVKTLSEEKKSVLLIGHNPGLHSLTLMLSGSGKAELRAQLAMAFPPGALASLEFSGAWNDVDVNAGTLVKFVTPDALKAKA